MTAARSGAVESQAPAGAALPKRRMVNPRGKRVMLARLDAALAQQPKRFFLLRGRTEAEMLRRVRRESDTGVVLMMTVLMEQELTDLLAATFIKDSHTRGFLKRLSSRLDLKISLANALGLMPPEMHADAVLVARIRNSLAHRPLSGSFLGRDVGKLVAQLAYSKVFVRRSRRAVFIHSVDRVIRRIRLARSLVSDLRTGRLKLAQVRLLMASANGTETRAQRGMGRGSRRRRDPEA